MKEKEKHGLDSGVGRPSREVNITECVDVRCVWCWCLGGVGLEAGRWGWGSTCCCCCHCCTTRFVCGRCINTKGIDVTNHDQSVHASSEDSLATFKQHILTQECFSLWLERIVYTLISRLNGPQDHICSPSPLSPSSHASAIVRSFLPNNPRTNLVKLK